MDAVREMSSGTRMEMTWAPQMDLQDMSESQSTHRTRVTTPVRFIGTTTATTHRLPEDGAAEEGLEDGGAVGVVDGMELGILDGRCVGGRAR